MIDPEPLLRQIIPGTLVAFRLAGVLIFAPLLSSVMIPARVKVLMVAMLAVAIYPALPPAAVAWHGSLSAVTLLPVVVGETFIGFVIGLLASIPLMSLEVAGVVMGQQMGFGLARVYNPEIDFDVDILGQLMFYIGFGIFLALGGLEVLVGAVVRSFERLPVGLGLLGRPPLDLLVGLLASGFELALRVAMPVVATIILSLIVFAVLGKTMPQISVMNIGFTIKIILGLLVIAAAVGAVSGAVRDDLARVLRTVTLWASEGS